MKNKKYLAIGIVLLVIFLIFILRPSNKLYPTDLITHGHGLAVDVVDSSKLYIATHHGLMVLVNDKDLYRIGKAEDDYMGFSMHPTDPNIFFTSGHPKIGGNLGFQISKDAGFKWKKVSNGLNGPVDFHAMTVSPANPNIIYGWYANNIQRSLDQGKTWQLVKSNLLTVSKGVGVYNLLADPEDESIVYAGTGTGLFVSKDKGSTWSILSDELIDTAIMSIAMNPKYPLEMFVFKPSGLIKSNDGGLTWRDIDESFNGETVFYIAYDKNNTEIIYILTNKNSIYKSINSGVNWNKIR